MIQQLHVVVLAGGSGTRFWPLSRRARPKQLLTLGGEQTLLAATFHRTASLAPPDRWWMVVGQAYADACRSAVPEVAQSQVLVEPVAKNTAPAIGLAALHLVHQDKDALMTVLPADHHVRDVPALCQALTTAAQLAMQGPIVTLGIEPVRPETGYGYIERGAADKRVHGAYKVQRFCEKPNLERARGFLTQGGYDWNAGIFVMRASAVLEEIERQLPAIHDNLLSIKVAIGTPAYDEVLKAAFEKMQSISVDYGVMEAAREVAVVPVSCGWSDVGSFSALDSVVPRDTEGNVRAGRTISIDSRDCVLYAEPGQVVAAIGVSGLAIIHTADATLVVPVDRAQEVRGVLDKLGQQAWTEFL